MAGASYSDEILITDLEENFADDPYGTATYVIRNTLHRAIKNSGSMSDQELNNLIALSKVLNAVDGPPR